MSKRTYSGFQLYNARPIQDQQFDSNSEVSLTLEGPPCLPSAGSSFNVTLHIDNVTGLWAWGGSLSWNPQALNLTGIFEGSLLASSGETMFLNSYNNDSAADGVLEDMGSAFTDGAMVSGNGDLATFTFQVLNGSAPTNITLTSSELDTLDSDGEIQQLSYTVNDLQLSPFMFSDGFEGGGFSAWNSTVNQTGGLVVVADSAFSGQYGARTEHQWVYNPDWECYIPYADSFTAALTENLTDCFVSFNANFTDLPLAGRSYQLAQTSGSYVWVPNTYLYLLNDYGQFKLRLYFENGSFSGGTQQVCLTSSPITITADSWVNVQFEYRVSSVNGTGANGLVAVWFNGEEVACQGGVNNCLLSDTNSVQLGYLSASLYDQNIHTIYFDDCKISNNYVAS